MPAVRIIGRAGWTSDIRAETQPVNANANSTITKVTDALDGPGISTMDSQGSMAPTANAAPTANPSRSGEVCEAGVMPYYASACAASAS